MKRTISLIIAYPILLGVGWFFTRLSERFGNSLADFDVEFDFE